MKTSSNYSKCPSTLARSVLLPALLLAFAAPCLSACGEDDDPAVSSDELPDNTSEAIATYSKIVEASYADTLSGAKDLDAAVNAFVDSPSEETQTGARKAWLDARNPYLQTEVFRFYEGPIDNAEDGPEGLLNAWPLDESYIDYVEGDETAGIINDTSKTIDAETLESLNEGGGAAGGEESISTGYHAVEFLLWGQDHSATGPGDRPYTDFVTDGAGTAENQERRAEYLRVVSKLIVDHLEDLNAAWAPGEDNYRKDFEAAEPEEALRRILTGMILLSGNETGGERLRPAWLSHMQEDEHSCFSDNTKADMVQDIQGVMNVWRGSYGTQVSGVGIFDVVAAKDAELADELDERIQKSLELANDLESPFDQEIVASNEEGNDRVLALIDSLDEQAKLLEKVFVAFGLDVPQPE